MRHRRSGVLLHPTSLPGAGAVGVLGDAATRFVEWLALAGQGTWQTLPLHPPGRHGSPYDALSAFAANPQLISIEALAAAGLLPAATAPAGRPAGRSADFAAAAQEAAPLLREAHRRFRALPSSHPGRRQLDELEAELAGSPWLSDWALFAALRRHHDGAPWWSWDRELRHRTPSALESARQRLGDEIAYERFLQVAFEHQWRTLRRGARERGVELLGDLPIFVARDSADVWQHPHLFDLDDDARPLSQAGVPPDYFCAEGQLWGNPLYRWEAHRAEGYRWWCDRLGRQLQLVDRVRLDHFRGFVACWRVPAGARTAIAGEWEPGPGESLFDALRHEHGDLPLIAEDLGVITPDVEALRDELGLPSTRVLQFAFDSDESPHLPFRIPTRAVAYTGTHDNPPTRSWLAACSEEERRRLRVAFGEVPDSAWALLRLAAFCPAELTVAPLQDVLDLGAEARMNTPGLAEGNWAWRVTEAQLNEATAHRLRELSSLSGRAAPPPSVDAAG